MQQTQTVVMLCQDASDRGLWESSMKEVPGLFSIAVDGDLPHALEQLRRAGATLRLVILSSRLYPVQHPELARLIRAACPQSELLLVSCSGAPAPPLMPLFADNVRHLAISPPGSGRSQREELSAAIEMLVARRPWEINSCLKQGTPIHSFQLRSTEDKEPLIGALDALLEGEGEEYQLLRQKGALLADELLENALYDAPRGAHGGRLFKKGEPRVMLPGERIVFSFGFDGVTLALKLTDNWGSLEPDLVIEFLARNQEAGSHSDDEGGRGLFIIWRFLDQFHVNVHPGQKTAVGGHLQLSSGLHPEAPRGFHITEHQIGEAA